MGQKEIQDLEDMLSAAAVMLPMPDGEDKLHFHDESYPYLKHLYVVAKADVAKLGMTEVVEHAIHECVVLIKQGKRREGQDLLIAACSQLRQRSGTIAEMREMYSDTSRR